MTRKEEDKRKGRAPQEKEIVKFFFELGQLAKVKRTGWWLIAEKSPNSISDHSFRAASIGYVMGKLEKVNAEKVALMCLFQDFPEARILDLHKLAQRYLDSKKAEKDAFREQVSRLPKPIADEMMHLWDQYSTDSSREGIIARDADLLENALEAREMIIIGYADAQLWIDSIRKILRTSLAKRLLMIIEKEDPNSWWKGLKRIER
ncbi:HD domain-containing protein [Candidatus Woesearchaeota archaeon]|nr:HD domain-containing protein [Candidatus Woesearchaeota archaeon]